eukprot:CAMPEP_0182573850 /NCGR_PEP_ID=MMETSP1324-20130603/20456_1 /TAXON_ID=236786 /ORGANISM="Florenciella sp., Strain RCC1587" /LENGTH=74 /DNA_ID=CAMNT_0024789011 /DNA_START=61 /DNA_END=282 /DNA_ORIENTATION=+
MALLHDGAPLALHHVPPRELVGVIDGKGKVPRVASRRRYAGPRSNKKTTTCPGLAATIHPPPALQWPVNQKPSP